MESEGRASLELAQARLLEPGIVVGIHAVDADHGGAGIEQRPRHVKADEARGSGNENGGLAAARMCHIGFPRAATSVVG